MTDVEIAEQVLEANIQKLLTDLVTKIVVDRGHAQPKLDAALIDQAAALLVRVIETAEGEQANG